MDQKDSAILDDSLTQTQSASSIFYSHHQNQGADHLWSKMAGVDPLHAVAAWKGGNLYDGKAWPKLLQEIRDQLSGTILDAGCGYGRLSIPLALERKERRIVGLDSSQTMLEIFRQEVVKHKGLDQQITLVQGGLERLPFQDASFDVVLSSAVLLHNPYPAVAQIIDEFYRVLKPGGRLILVGSFPNLANLQGIINRFYSWLHPHKNGPVRSFSRNHVQKLMNSFSRVEISAEGLLLLPPSLLKVFPFPLLKKAIKKINQLFTRFAFSFFAKTGFFVIHHDVCARK